MRRPIPDPRSREDRLRRDEYEVCRKRGHVADGTTTASDPPRRRCKWCGIWFFWSAAELVESDVPPKLAKVRLKEFVGYKKDPDTGCWNWLHAKVNGYGRLHFQGKSLQAHRWYYERFKGPIPEGLQLDHLCRNPGCVNPDHLEAVTAAENSRRRPSTKLNIVTARQIREAALAGGSPSLIARRFGVSEPLVCDIREGRAWVDDGEVARYRKRLRA